MPRSRGNGQKNGNNKNNNQNTNQGRQNQNNTNGNKYCSYCQSSTHAHYDCFKNSQSPKFRGNSLNQNQNQNQNQTRYNQQNNNSVGQKVPNRPCKHCQGAHYDNKCDQSGPGNSNNFQNTFQPLQVHQSQLPFNHPCNWCGGTDHYQTSCSNRQPTLPYIPTVYPAPPVQPTGTIYPFTQPTAIRPEYVNPPPINRTTQAFITPQFTGPTRYDAGTQHCQHLPHMDKDGDIIMEAVERCAECQPQIGRTGECHSLLPVWGQHLTQSWNESVRYQHQHPVQYYGQFHNLGQGGGDLIE